MPTLKSVNSLMEQAQQPSQSGDVISRLITRYPYRDYGLALDGRDGALVVAFPNGMKIRVQSKTIDYYSRVFGGNADGKEDFAPVMSKIKVAEDSQDYKERTAELKEIIRYMARTEYKQEKYSFIAYVLGQQKLPVERAKAIYFAYADDSPEGLSSEDKKVYQKAVDYALAYYKFLVGMLTVID